ncbi:SRR1-like protein [Rhynchophorus ferrugineus]|uniref:SRR1-like domain-containing protein n=1 Tax=Rhynchophorus ferrugineus TaxID=354439 RepID=A0A834M2X7_RHYFE|nr:hypothetical protein GWI33_018105 [Rhynchophorus ferrugineus]
MSTATNLDDVFTKVSYKRKGKIKNKINKNSNIYTFDNCDTTFIDKDKIIRRIVVAKEEFLATGVYESFTALLTEGLTILKKPKISKIVCFGLGHVSELTISRYQFVLLLCLKELYKLEVLLYDPVFNENDIFVLKYFGMIVESKNIEGKYLVTDNKTTLFYLPHCPKQLLNNLLWANWGLSLSCCIIISNSINKVVEDHTIKELSISGEYIAKISPYALELGLVNNFKFFEVFNDTSLHFFPINDLSIVPVDFWEENVEPVYNDGDVEFITSQFMSKLTI